MSKTAYVFPGQGAQFVGMGKELYSSHPVAKELFDKANEILGFRITDIMFDGTDEELKQTKVTQPAVFLHSVIRAVCLGEEFQPDMVAGHSLGEFSALVASGALSFEDGLRLVSKRALAMQAACEANPGTMAAVLGLPDEKVEEVVKSIEGVDKACELLKEAGAKRALRLNVGGAFHSPLMEPARVELEAAIEATEFHAPRCPIYQNVTASPTTDIDTIRRNLIAQLTAPVRWTESVKAMVADGASRFVEVGPGAVLQGLVKKIAPEVETEGRQ